MGEVLPQKVACELASYHQTANAHQRVMIKDQQNKMAEDSFFLK
jgi:hypothetical protein